MKTAAIVIAADDSPGFGGSKYLSEFRGATLIETVVAEVHKWPVDTVLVVLGVAADEILERADLGDSVVVVDLEPDGGAVAGLRIGIDTLYRLDEHDTLMVGDGLNDGPPSRLPGCSSITGRGTGQR